VTHQTLLYLNNAGVVSNIEGIMGAMDSRLHPEWEVARTNRFKADEFNGFEGKQVKGL
jgi:hypothetical protein